ncbi:MAG: CBS domain-containing protein [Kiloniellales bacterium]|nr:CBS domain-containing protein [Kiloniellales bacterium]MDJ0970201.1 CBS domain-containing protein [Kiloniellales bacterium]
MQRKIIPDVISGRRLMHLGDGATVREAAQVMREEKIGCVLVMDGQALLGIFTERDLVTRVVAEGLEPDTTRLHDVMTRDPDTISADDMAIEALRLMDDGGFRHLPVLKDGQVVGVVSRRDFSGLEKARMDEEAAIWDRIR